MPTRGLGVFPYWITKENTLLHREVSSTQFDSAFLFMLIIFPSNKFILVVLFSPIIFQISINNFGGVI
jgi:hypothetical protein